MNNARMVPLTNISGIQILEAVNGNKTIFVDSCCDPQTIFGWSKLNELLTYSGSIAFQTRLIGPVEPPPAIFENGVAGGGRTYQRLVPPALHSALTDGYTLVVDQVEQLCREVDSIARSLSGTLLSRVQANIYASLAGAPGFGAHRDQHDVLVIQISGTKNWEIGGQAGPQHFTLHPGSAIFVPQNTLHTVSTGTDGSLHITFAIPRPNVRELIQSSLKDLDNHSAIDLPLPISARQDIHDQLDTILDLEERFRVASIRSGVLGGFVNLPVAAAPELLRDSDLIFLGEEESERTYDFLSSEGRILHMLNPYTGTEVGEICQSASGFDATDTLLDLVREGRVRVSHTSPTTNG